jgi:hypothetical protein
VVGSSGGYGGSMQQPSAASSSSTSSSKGGGGGEVDWDWAFVVGRKPGRKPAIKRPARHQWYYCNPNYDPSAPRPARILPPHAPPSAADADDWQRFNASLAGRAGGLAGDKARREFVRYLHLRDVDWRDAFNRGLAQYVGEFKRAQRSDAERARQSAWHEYRARLFEQAAAGGGQQAGDAAAGGK